MYMGVLGIVMSDGYPFEFGTEILFHSLHHVPGKALQIDAVAELRPQNELPEELIPVRLPLLQATGHVNSLPGLIEPSPFRVSFEGCALACQVPPMC
jgi:hypothetical protein